MTDDEMRGKLRELNRAQRIRFELYLHFILWREWFALNPPAQLLWRVAMVLIFLTTFQIAHQSVAPDTLQHIVVFGASLSAGIIWHVGVMLARA